MTEIAQVSAIVPRDLATSCSAHRVPPDRGPRAYRPDSILQYPAEFGPPALFSDLREGAESGFVVFYPPQRHADTAIQCRVVASTVWHHQSAEIESTRRGAPPTPVRANVRPIGSTLLVLRGRGDRVVRAINEHADPSACRVERRRGALEHTGCRRPQVTIGESRQYPILHTRRTPSTRHVTENRGTDSKAFRGQRCDRARYSTQRQRSIKVLGRQSVIGRDVEDAHFRDGRHKTVICPAGAFLAAIDVAKPQPSE